MSRDRLTELESTFSAVDYSFKISINELTSVIELGYVCGAGLFDQGSRLCRRPAEEPVPYRGTAGAAAGHVARVTCGARVKAQGTRVVIIHVSMTLNIVQTVCLVDKLPPMPHLNHLVNMLTI